MSTPNGSLSPYLTADTLVLLYDWRTLADLCSDSGTRLTQSALLSSPVLAQLLLSASGMVEAACLTGERYSAADLAGLTGASQAFLGQLVADLTMGLAIRRRPDKKLPIPPAFLQALDWLQQLADGRAVFALQEVEAAGLPSAYEESAMDVQARDLVVTQARRFFGRRVDQSPQFPTG